MTVQIRNIQVSGRVNINKLEDVFGEIYEKNTGMTITNPGDKMLFVEAESDENYDIYDWKSENRDTRFRIISQGETQDEIIPKTNGTNLVIDGQNADKMLSKFKEEFENDIEIVTTTYVFQTNEPILPAERREENGAVYHWEGNNLLENITASIGSTTINVVSSIENEEEAREEFQKYLEKLKNKEDWPPSPTYRKTFQSPHVDMNILRNEFNVQETVENRENSKDNTAVYIKFDEGIVGIDTDPVRGQNIVLSESPKSFEETRKNVEKITRTGALEINENKLEEIIYNNDDIVEVGHIE